MRYYFRPVGRAAADYRFARTDAAELTSALATIHHSDGAGASLRFATPAITPTRRRWRVLLFSTALRAGYSLGDETRVPARPPACSSAASAASLVELWLVAVGLAGRTLAL